ncbi:MAG TPA: type II secretion system protein [Candidatus Ozemobacteraceae bacterium]|mgnify:CR=1 FL=1|nr:type II secretion system protein [Candidatus Ozemobacteraceae bacterium]
MKQLSLEKLCVIGRQHGISLIELMVALVLVGIAVIPVIPVFTQSYVSSSRQVDQEMAIKIAEATVNQMGAVRFDHLNNPGVGVSVPLRYEVPGGTVNASLNLSGSPGTGSASFKIAKTPYEVGVSVTRLFDAVSNPLVFYYFDAFAGKIASYACPDDFLKIDVLVQYQPGDVPVIASLTSFRANLVQ